MYFKKMKSVLLALLAVSVLCVAGVSAQELSLISTHAPVDGQQMQEFANTLLANYPEAQSANAFYIGAEVCLMCHTSRTPESTHWLHTKHSYFIRKPMATYTLKAGKGVMANSLKGSVDDFMMGLDFNNIRNSPFEALIPNAPILSYDAAADKYYIQLGPTGVKLWVVATLAGQSVGNGQRYMVRVPVSDTTSKWSDSIYFGPAVWGGTGWTTNIPAWYTGNTPNVKVGGVVAALTNTTMQGQNYLKQCSGCHITGVKKAYLSKAGEYVVNPYPAIMLPTASPNYPDLDGDGNADLANISCESCHGPGSNHVGNPKDATLIVNPAEITDNRLRSNVCLQCHVQIASAPNKTWGFTYDEKNNKPYVLTNPPQALDAYQVFTGGKWPDGWNYVGARIDSYKSSAHYTGSHGIACNDCHNSHAETTNPAQVRDTITRSGVTVKHTMVENNSFCLGCHAGYGPFAKLNKGMINAWDTNLTAIREVTEAHTHHPEGAERSFGLSRCTTCHMAPTSGHGTIEGATHTFMPARPEDTIALAKTAGTGNTWGSSGNINSCSASCHRGKAIVWTDIPANPTPNDVKFGTANEIELAKHLVNYFGPGGLWWNTKP